MFGLIRATTTTTMDDPKKTGCCSAAAGIPIAGSSADLPIELCGDDDDDDDNDASHDNNPTSEPDEKNRESSFKRRSAEPSSSAATTTQLGLVDDENNKNETTSQQSRKRPMTMMPNHHHNMVPIKIFRTKQMEQQQSSSSSSSSSSSTSKMDPFLLREYTTTLRELLLDPTKTIRWLIISNYIIDFSLLLDEVPELISIHLIVCFYGRAIDAGPLQQLQMAFRCNDDDEDGSTTRFHAICLKPSDPPRSRNNPLSQQVKQ
jgi:hypothetical protein